MTIIISKSMVVAALKLVSRTSISALDSRLVTKTKTSSMTAQQHDLDDDIQVEDDLSSVIVNLISPFSTLLESVGLNDPSMLPDDASLTDAQKALVSRLEEAVALVIQEVAGSLPVALIDNDRVTSDAALYSMLYALSPISSDIFGPIACLLDAFGFSGKLPLIAEEDTIIRELQAAISDAIKQLEAPSPKFHRVKWEIGLPESPLPTFPRLSRRRRVQKRRFGSASSLDKLRPHSMFDFDDGFELSESEDFGEYVRRRFGRIDPVLGLNESFDEYA